jgi:hypothetical protein
VNSILFSRNFVRDIRLLCELLCDIRQSQSDFHKATFVANVTSVQLLLLPRVFIGKYAVHVDELEATWIASA